MSKPSADWSVLTRLKTRQIVLLVYLDQCGSVLRAAEATGMTQPCAR
ncbi:MAG TPA: LysR family transcriptional regulator [Steroidobacter sp.]